ncbi:MAG: hypothetical protein M0C28_14780 [Candidatus Moduliflexus flocculans]|nr:hypothetical protein [Candidatus Moduliflexus flocculans]
MTLPAARVAGAGSLAGLDETTLRTVPALFGAGLLLALLLFAGGLAREAVLAAAALAAVSPAMTYYSRFYIQETLLVFFLAVLPWRGVEIREEALRGMGYRCRRRGRPDVRHEGDERHPFRRRGGGVRGRGALGESGFQARRDGHGRGAWIWRDARTKLPTAFHAGLFLVAGAAVAVLFYTSFFQDPRGIVDSIRAIGASFDRAGHPGFHAHPWDFYLRTLAYSKTAGNPVVADGPVWSEAFLLFLAAAGGIAALGNDAGKDGSPRFMRFILFFTVFTAAAYSLIPYKTPWNLLPFHFGLAVLAGGGVALLLRISRFRLVKLVVLAALTPGFANLAVQSYRANFELPADPSNPYVYAQTSPDLLRLVGEVEKAAAAAPEKSDLFIAVVAPPEETWPLPWYFRGYTRVGYWTSPEAARSDVGAARAAVVVASAAFADEIGAELGEGYLQTYYGLRPEVVLALFVRR